MSRISSSYLQRMCDPTWVAKAYSEYMLDCANAQSKMIQDLSDLCNDTQADSIANQLGIELDGYLNVIKNQVERTMVGLYSEEVLAPDDYIVGSDKWIHTIDYLYETTRNTDHEFYTALQGILSIDRSAQSLINHEGCSGYFLKYTIDDMISRSSEFTSRVSTAVWNKLDENNYNDQSIYTLTDGFVNMREFMKQYMTHTILNLDPDIGLEVYNVNNESEGFSQFNLDDLTEDMKSSFSSCIAWGFAFDAIRETSISDAITKFDSLISTVISDTSERFASIVNTARSMLTSHINSISTFFDDAGRMLGWDSIINDSFVAVNQTDIFAYTGASPLGAVNLNSAKGLASAVVKTVAAVGSGIFSAAKSLLGKLWVKAKPIVKAITDNPVDIAVEDDKDESYACSNFKYTVSDYLYLNYSGDFQVIGNIINSHASDWYSIKTLFGEITFKLFYDSSKSISGTMCIKIDMQCRISNIAYRQLLNYGIVTVSSAGTNEEHMALFANWNSDLNKFDNFIQSGDYRPTNDEDEAYLYMGFIFATLLQASLGDMSATDLGLQMNNVYGIKVESVDYKYNDDAEYSRKTFSGEPLYGFYVGRGLTVPSNVTNLDFIKSTCGFRASSFGKINSFGFISEVDFPGPGATPINRDVPVLLAFSGFIVSFLYQQYDKHFSPTDYFFLPYCKGTYAFSGGRYRIKTDAENANVAGALASAIIIVAVVASAIILCKSVTSIFKAKRIANLQRKVTLLNSKMSTGQKLNSIDAISYRRASSKLSKLQNLSSGLAGSGSKLSNITNKVNSLSSMMTDTVGIDPIESIKQGQLVSSANDSTKYIISLIRS